MLGITQDQLLVALEWIGLLAAAVVAVILAIAVVLAALAGLMVLLQWIVKRLGPGKLGAAGDALAAIDLDDIRKLADEPTDILVVLLTRAMRQEPAKIITAVDALLDAAEKLKGYWPDLKDALDKLTPLNPPDKPE